MNPSTGTVMALVNHPNLDIVLGPVLRELQARGHAVKALVVEFGRADRLAAMNLPLVDELTEFDAFLETPGPRVMINAADIMPQHRLGIHIDLLCRAAGVPTLTLEHAPFSLGYGEEFPPHLEFAADVMAVIGSEDERRYRNLGVDPARLVVTGSPEFDGLVRTRGSRPAAPDADPAADTDTIAIFGQSHTWTGKGSSQGIAPEVWRKALTRLYRLLGERYPTARLRVKPHPAEPLRGTEALYTEAIPEDMAQRVEVVPTSTVNADLILGSRLVISFSSTVWLEARILGRPCACFILQERPGRLGRDIPALGGLWLPSRTVDFAERLQPHLEALTTGDTGGPPTGLEPYTGPLDGHATARIADLAEQLLHKGAPRVPMPVLVFDRPEKQPRRLWPDSRYADYVHFQGMADACLVQGLPQPAVLAVTPDHRLLRRHLPLAFYAGYGKPMAAGQALPFAEGSFDGVAAPDLLLRVPLAERAAVMAALLKIARRKVVTSLPTALGRAQWQELQSLVDLDPKLAPVFGGDHDLDELDRWLRTALGCAVQVRPCHQVMSWSQSLILESLGLDEQALATLRLSAQATGYPQEDQGRPARWIYILTPNSPHQA